MNRTPERVREILVRSGRSVTLRQLADWRHKDLLPPLEREKGQGRAAKYVWTQSDIVKQAAIIHDLLCCWYGRTEWLALPRWLLGYEVPIEEVRRMFLLSTERALAAMTQGETDLEELEEHLKDVASNLIYRWKYSARPMPSNFKEATPEDREAALDFLIQLFANKDYQPNEEQLASAWRGLETKHKTNGATAPGASGESPELLLLTRFVNKHLSLQRRHDAVVEATAEEWEQAHRDFRDTLALLTTFYKLLPPFARFPRLPSWWMQVRMQYNLLVEFGQLLLPALLALRQDGYGDWIEMGLAKAQEFLTDPEVREKMQTELTEQQLQRAAQRYESEQMQESV